MGVPILSSAILSTDRNGNNVPDRSELPPGLHWSLDRHLYWSKTSPFFYPEFSPDLLNWLPLTSPVIHQGDMVTQEPLLQQSSAFFRLRSMK
jgi:hypothetical protein